MTPPPRPHSHRHHNHHHHHHPHSHHSSPSSSTPIPPSPIWWSNTLFFLGFHLAAIYGVIFLKPWSQVGWKTAGLCLASWQAASFGVWIHVFYFYFSPWIVIWNACFTAVIILMVVGLVLSAIVDLYEYFQSRLPLNGIGRLQWRGSLMRLLYGHGGHYRVTIGYHRLWSHKAFTARLPLRICLAWMASLGFQGSAKWWVLRHRLHHRFTDDPIHDPYSATRGLWFAHCGWIFRRPNYPRLKLIEKDDLEDDIVVRIQHKYFVPIAVFSGLVMPTLIAKYGWGDAIGGYVWGGLVARLLIWHTTFCINSLAHWTGLQPYTEEVTARGNYLLALLTSGEGNHNYHHLFPSDFRNGPHPQDWDPTKWIIWVLHKYTPLVPTIRRTPDTEILKAKAHVHRLQADRLTALVPEEDRPKEDHELPEWTLDDAMEGVEMGKALLLIDGYLVDVTEYLEDHPGGSGLLRNWSIRAKAAAATLDEVSRNKVASSMTRRKNVRSPSSIDSGYESLNTSGRSSPTNASSADESTTPAAAPIEAVQARILKDASRAFFGQINNHSQAAKEKMRCLRVAKLVASDQTVDVEG